MKEMREGCMLMGALSGIFIGLGSQSFCFGCATYLIIRTLGFLAEEIILAIEKSKN